MLYYKVKPKYDNTRLFNRKKRTYEGILIGNELYTVLEYDALINKYRIPRDACDLVQINKNTTYFFFGARFAEGCQA